MSRPGSHSEKYSFLLIGIVLVAGIGVAAARAFEPPENRSSNTVQGALELRPATAMETAAVLPEAVIWHPAGEAALVYQPLDQRPAVTYTWVRGTPRRWIALPAGPGGNAHLIWLNTQGELWHSQVESDGQPRLAATNLASEAVTGMSAGSLPGGGAAIVWQARRGIRAPLSLTVLDALGRPQQTQRLTPDADRFDLTTDHRGRLYLVWTSTVLAGQRDLYFAITTLEALAGNRDLTASAAILHLTIPHNAWLDSLIVLADQAAAYLVWGVNTADRPEATDFECIVLSTADGTERARFKLRIPDGAADARLRWPGRVTDLDAPPAAARLGLTARLDGEWRAVLISLTEGGVQDIRVLSDLPATASAPQALIQNEHITAAWTRLDNRQKPVQQIITTQPGLLLASGPTDRPTLAAHLLQGLLSLPYGAVWLFAPALLLLGLRQAALSPPITRLSVLLALGGYWLVKDLWPDKLYTTPRLFDGSDLSPGAFVLLALAGSTGMALIAAWLALLRQRTRQTWLAAYLLCDAILTCLVFGANLV